MKHTVKIADVLPHIKHPKTIASFIGVGESKQLVAVMDAHGVVYEVYENRVLIKETGKLDTAVDVYNSI